MKFCISLIVVCLLTIATPAFAIAAPDNPPILTASHTADGFMVTVTGTVSDENLTEVNIVINGSISGSETSSVNSDGTFSVTIDVPPFAENIEIVAIDEFGKIDVVTLNL